MLADDVVLVWPPTLDDLKADLEIQPDDHREDDNLVRQLEAAKSFVRRTHLGRYEFGTDAFAALSPLPPPGAEMVLGTVRLAVRWYTRRRSPEGIVAMGEQGSQNIPAFDSDLEKMLEMGRYSGSMIV